MTALIIIGIVCLLTIMTTYVASLIIDSEDNKRRLIKKLMYKNQMLKMRNRDLKFDLDCLRQDLEEHKVVIEDIED